MDFHGSGTGNFVVVADIEGAGVNSSSRNGPAYRLEVE